MTLIWRLLHGAFVWLPSFVFGLNFPGSAISLDLVNVCIKRKLGIELFDVGNGRLYSLSQCRNWTIALADYDVIQCRHWPTVTSNACIADDFEVLMLLQSGGGVSVRNAWLDRGGIPGLQRHHKNITFREIALGGDYRTDYNVDQLSVDEVYVVFLNAVTDPLWWIAFNGTAVDELKWFQEVTQSSSNILNYSVNVNTSGSSESFYAMYVGTGRSSDPAWAAILNSSTSGSPLFIFNADPNTPHEFPRGLTKASYVGCSLYDNYNLIYAFEDLSQMNVRKCTEMCSEFPFVVLQMGFKCLCGSPKHQQGGSSQSAICDQNCPNSDEICGGLASTSVAVYQMMDDEPQDIGQISCSVMKPHFSTENNEILISKYLHLSDFAANQIYIRGHRLSYSQSTTKYRYFMSYNMEDCLNTSRITYIDMLSGNPKEFTSGDFWNTTLIPAVCIWFSSPQYSLFGLHYILSNINLELEICVPQTGSYFFPADYLAIIGTFQHSSIDSTENRPTDSDGVSTTKSDMSSHVATEYKDSKSSTPGTTSNVISTTELVYDESSSSNVTEYIDPRSSTREINSSAISTTELASDEPSSPNVTGNKDPGSSTREIVSAATSTTEFVSDEVAVSISSTNGVFSSSLINQNTDVFTAASIDLSSRNSENQMITPYSNFLCSCACSNTSSENLQGKLDHLKSILTVDKKALSSVYRKLNCAHDSRLSSKGIGATGLVILLAFIGIILLMDLTSIIRF